MPPYKCVLYEIELILLSTLLSVERTSQNQLISNFLDDRVINFPRVDMMNQSNSICQNVIPTGFRSR